MLNNLNHANWKPPVNDRATPWGRADDIDVIADGITFYSAPSHGGFHLSAERLERIDPRARAYAAKWSHGWGESWFEEDCAASAVVLAFPEHFKPIDFERATAIARHWR